MQTTSELYKALLANPNHYAETMVKIGGVEYREDKLVMVKTTASIFPGNDPTVGGCVARKIKLTVLKPDYTIPPMARLEPYVRLTDGIEHSEWIPKGKFYIDTRQADNVASESDALTIEGYCDILKAEADCPFEGTDWPATDIAVLQIIASDMGVELDQRTIDIVAKGYMIELPAQYSEREVLSAIAAMYGGSFIMSDEGKLLLVQMTGIPEETNYLIRNNGDAITFGGVRILV